MHRVHLRDRIGVAHPLRADAGCRNTLYNAQAQTGAQFHSELAAAGLRHFRVELLEESAEETHRILHAYQALFSGEQTGEHLWRNLHALAQIGVTKGTYQE
jgi:putative protease